MSLQRHIAMLRAPLAVSHGTCETPELRRSAIAVTVAVDTAGHHQDMRESLGNPHGINGRAALAMMELPA